LDNILLQGYEYEKPIIINKIVPKLIDFGLSTLLLQGEKSTVAVGSLAFLSPEIVKGEAHD
jgi:serine/threonine protein kinase